MPPRGHFLGLTAPAYMTLEKIVRPTAWYCRGNGIRFIEYFLALLPKQRGNCLLYCVLFGPSHLINDESI